MGQHVGPDWVPGIGGLRNDPEVLFWMVDEGDGLAADRGHGPMFAEEVEGEVGVESTLVVEGQVEVQQRHGGWGAVVVALFLEGEVPGGVGGEAGGAAGLMLVVPGDLGLEQGVGVLVVGDLLEGQEGDEALLEGVEAALDFAFGLGVGGDAVGRPQGGEGALELGVGVEAVGRGTMAEEGQAVGVEGRRQAVLFQGRAQVHEMAPGRVAGGEGGGDDFAGVIVEGEDQRRIGLGRPPRVRGGVMLPEFTQGGTLPAATGFGAMFGSGQSLGKVLANIGGDGGAGAVKVKAAGQFIGQEGEIEGLAVGQELGQEGVGRGRPIRAMVAAGGGQTEGVLVEQPLMAQFVEPGAADHQPLGGGGRVELTRVEGGEDFLDIEELDPMSELFLFIGAEE